MESLLKKIPQCRAIAVTGQKAMDTILQLIDASEPAMGGYSEFIFANQKMRLYRMPSSSRAYPKPLKEKASFYQTMLKETLIFKEDTQSDA